MKRFWRFTAYISGRQYFNPFLRGFRIPIPDYPQPASQPTNQPAFNLASQPAIQPAIEPGSQPGSGEKRSEKLSEKQSEFFTKRNATKKLTSFFTEILTFVFHPAPGRPGFCTIKSARNWKPMAEFPPSHLPRQPASQQPGFSGSHMAGQPVPQPVIQPGSQPASQPSSPPSSQTSSQCQDTIL